MPDRPDRVPANDFARQWDDVGEDALAAVDRVGRSGSLILGSEVESFEREFASWWGFEHAVGVASGLDAIEIALRCGDLPPGSQVLTTPLTAFATTLAVIRAGCEPVWADVDESGGLDLDRAEAALRDFPAIRALVPVHLFGHPLDRDGLRRLAADHDLVLIEDCAQSAGASRDGEPTGTAGLAAATSLYPTKNLGAMGDGGVLLSADADLAARARSLRNYGRREDGSHGELGLNSRLDELQAAILRSALLPRLDRFLARRREIAGRYEDGLAGSGLRPIAPGGGESARHLFPVEAVEGDPIAVAAELRAEGIAIGRHYPGLGNEQPAAAGVGAVHGSLDVARRLSEREISLPIHPYLGEDEVDRVIAACLSACG
jgi:dTDP-3-amino-3,4,6-trideoxy-alpha-D-glucose transaminase